MKFYVGLHQPAQAKHFERVFISINRVRGRRKPVPALDTMPVQLSFRL